MQPLVIAVDAMGGDHAPDVVIAGAESARERYPDLSFLFYGDEAKVRPLLVRHPLLMARSVMHHTDQAVAAGARVAHFIRAGRDTSMWLAINAVVEGKALAAVSGGNTGVLMAMAKIALKPLPGIDRPAIACFYPTMRGESVLLDLGANVECGPENLVQFAVMGALFARAVLGIAEPTVGLLNIGSEDAKGTDVVRAAALQLRQQVLPGRFVGFVEGDGIAGGVVDVVVADGFAGNVALKTMEGMARMFRQSLRNSFDASLMARVGYAFSRSALMAFGHRIDPNRRNGAMFLGLDGICVKSHGGADAMGFANAISVAADLVRHGFNHDIKLGLERLRQTGGHGLVGGDDDLSPGGRGGRVPPQAPLVAT